MTRKEWSYFSNNFERLVRTRLENSTVCLYLFSIHHKMTFLIHVNKLLRELFGPTTIEEDIISRAYYMSKIDSTEVICGNVRQMIAYGWFVPPSTSIYYSCDDDLHTTQHNSTRNCPDIYPSCFCSGSHQICATFSASKVSSWMMDTLYSIGSCKIPRFRPVHKWGRGQFGPL